ncbi:kinase domain protein [Oesophagostomum dentatum]|uniref:non-specific serine/threonine protein kinase n=1 Tax=Oesophagostomum dentatum TaxID=61180 RepID=A0A0B1TK04_OESDE|nr:kinase domain protein [Oesophagostomum dentatum]
METNSSVRESCSKNGAAGDMRMRCLSDYEIKREIGEGSFSIVYAAAEKADPHRDVAIKMCFKKQIIKEKRVASVHREKCVLARLSSQEHDHPFIVTLYATFQDRDHLYFVLSYAKYGDLLHIMFKRPEKRFNVEDSRFYAAEILSGLQHIHSLSYVHRDLKPENCLLGANGHVMISDFGSVKDLSVKEEKQFEEKAGMRIRRCSFVGTAQYVSPEVLEGAPVSPATDLWSFGVVIYQFLTGRHAFHDESEYLIYRRIQKLLYSYPPDFPKSAKDCVDRLLVLKKLKFLFVAPLRHMAKVIRNRWVYRPHNRWHRYLPRRNDGIKEFTYETGGSIAEFREEMMSQGHEEPKTPPSKLWMAWLYRNLSGEPHWTKDRVAKLFGSDYKVGRMELFPNTAAINEELWHVKHLIDLKPVTFPNGEPTEEDIYGVKFHPDGRCEVAKGAPPLTEEQLKLYDPEKQWTSKELNRQLASKYFGCKDVFETNVYTNSNISVVR